ncbi:MAG: DegT/DnrJ/EryC1/StrS family aminotransferase [Bacteroidales bacterium]|nr:DegT/DnrJ/EryC1/StrS family aminotransferase [Bacteroidales bacterium]
MVQNPIPMVDLASQYQKIKKEIDQAIQTVIDDTAFINGPHVKSFKSDLEKYLDVKHVIPCGNGTDALQIAMMALGLKHGDEVITANFTFVATVEVIALLGLTPVLVDVLPDTYTMDIEAVKRAITPKTKAIVPVHLFGQVADMDELMEIAEENNLFVIEDTAQAIGADYTFKSGRVAKAGTIGHIGTTSFFPSKNLGCYGDGGAIFTNDDSLAEKLQSVVNHGMKVRYYHDNVGVNSRLDTIQAAILSVKLPYLDQYNKSRREVADYYDRAFSSCQLLKTPYRSPQSTHTFHQYTLVLDQSVDRETLQSYLNEQGISSAVYYPVPLHLQKAYRDERYKEGDFPVTEHLCENVISLPIHTEMNEEILKYITDHVLNFLKSL